MLAGDEDQCNGRQREAVLAMLNSTATATIATAPTAPESATDASTPIAVAVVLVVLGAVGAVFFVRRQRRREAPRGALDSSALLLRAQTLLHAQFSKAAPDLLASGAVASHVRVVPAHSLAFGPTLGQGAHGRIVRATGTAGQALAVKLPLPGPDAVQAEQGEALLAEALMLSLADGHPGIMPVVGVLVGPPVANIGFVCPLMVNGDLKRYLQRCRPTAKNREAVLTLNDVATMAESLGSAMVWLEEHALIHRDVAARNVLVGRAGPREVRLGDLGAARVLSGRNVYSASTAHTPFRWMAPESLSGGSFSHKSDVWAFGVLLWEITSLGQTPYRLHGNSGILAAINAGERLPEEAFTPPRLYHLMARCWSASPRQRPAFATIATEMAAIRISVAALPNIGGASLGVDGILTCPTGDEGYLAVQASLEGPGRVLDSQGYVAEPTAVKASSLEGPGRVLDSQGYVAEPTAVKASSSEGPGRVLDSLGYVAEPGGATVDAADGRCPTCHAKTKWCACGTDETRL